MGSRTVSPLESMASLRTRRELLLLGGALAFGLLVIPLLIWVVGHWTLGPYTHGDSGPGYGPVVLLTDYFSGLLRGSAGYWIVALGPVLLLCAVRLWLMLVRRFPRD